MQRTSKKFHKPRFIAFAAASVDGRISLVKAALPTWTSKEDQRFFQKSLAQCDAFVVGRNTYHAAASALRRRTTYVLTSRIKKEYRKGSVTFVNPKTTDFVRLFSAYGTVAILGGAAVYRLMAERGLLHELYLTIEPLLFGRGTPLMLGGTRTIALRLISVRKLNAAGTLLLHYSV